MSKMIIYFCLFIPLLFLSTDSSSIRGRNNKNDLVPFSSSRLDTLKKDPNSLKVVSKEPFIIQFHTPNSKEMEARAAKEKDKNRKRPVKKRVSKIKSLRKRQRKRRDLVTSKTKPREENLIWFKIPPAANETKTQLQNISRNSVNRNEILKVLSTYPKKAETKRNKLDGIRNVKEEEKINTEKTKKSNTSNRSLHKHYLSLSNRTTMVYPSTPKLDRPPQKYTYKDLMADRERLEQKLKYIKNMLNANDSTADDAVRVRRRSDSDRTANKMTKMFLTLSAMNGLHDRRKSKCNDADEDDDRAEDLWEKEKRNNLNNSHLRKSKSSNEERYKVKKWIEFMKNKRSSGKTCPCLGNAYNEENDAFPLEQKLPKGSFLLEREISSEESSESYGDPYHTTDKLSRNDNAKKRLTKSQDQDAKIKTPSKNGKKKLELPFEDLELYRSRARQILQNAEEILDKIKEEEEKRLAAPNIFMNQLKELTSRIHGGPRNNENDLIQIIQKNLGWGPLTKSEDNTNGTILDNVKSFILDPYEKAKALTDESKKKLSSYLLQNLGILQVSSEEQEKKSSDDESVNVYFEEVPLKKEKLSSASLAKEEPRTDDLSKDKEDLQNWEDTLSAILGSGEDTFNKESNWSIHSEEPSQREEADTVDMEDKVKQKELNINKEQSIKETENAEKESIETLQSGREIVADIKPESLLEEERVAMKLNEKKKSEDNQDTTESQATREKNEKGIKSDEIPAATTEKTTEDSGIVKSKNFRGLENTFHGKKEENYVTASPDMQRKEEFEKGIEEILKSNGTGLAANEEALQNFEVDENEEKLEKQKAKNEKEKGKENTSEIGRVLPEIEKTTSEEERADNERERVEKKIDVSSPLISLVDEAPPNDSGLDKPTENEKNSKESNKGDFRKDEFESNEKYPLTQQRKLDDKLSEELKTEEDLKKTADPEAKKESSLGLEELLRESEKEHHDMAQKESNAETDSEFGGLVQEAEQQSKEFLEANLSESKLDDQQSFETVEDVMKKGDDETLKLDDDKNQDGKDTFKGDTGGENLKALLDNERNGKTLEGKTENSWKEDSTEDPNTPLGKTLESQENINEALDHHDGSSKENDDYVLLQETNFDNQKKETLKEDINDETLKKTENKSQEILGEEKNYEISLSAEKTIEGQKRSKSTENDEKYLQETNPDEEVSEKIKQKGAETSLRAIMNNQEQNSDTEDTNETQEYNSSEINEEDGNLNKERSNETNLQASLDKDEDLMNGEIILKAKSPNDDERNDKFQKLNDNQENFFNSVKSPENRSQLENQQSGEERGSTETSLGVVLDTQERENLDKEIEEATIIKENKNAKNIKENDNIETILQARIPDENLNIEDTETNQDSFKPLSSKEVENLKGSNNEGILKEANPDENIQDETNINSKEKSSYEILKEISDNQKQESLKTGDDEVNQGDLDLNKSSENENLKAVLDNETQETLEESPDEEILEAVKLDDESEGNDEVVEATLGSQNNDEGLKDGMALTENIKGSEENLKDDDVGTVLDNTELQNDKNEQNFEEDKSKRNEQDIEEKIDVDINNQNSNDDILKLVSNEQDKKNFKENDSVQAENPDEYQEKEINDEGEAPPLKSASLGKVLHNKKEYDTSLRSAQSMEEFDNSEPIKNINKDESVESQREENVDHDLNNQINQIKEDGDVLRLIQVDANFDSGLNENDEAKKGENFKTKEELPSKATNPEGKNSHENLQEIGQFSFSGDPQKPDSSSKSLKASKLRVPHSIGKIMKDLEGKEKSDITSIEHLNPDKIDHMLDKIGEAEQQNQLEVQEVDCRKECACAEEMNTRSRNIGRYEIVKDFLQWVKDLQLNRVLSDD